MYGTLADKTMQNFGLGLHLHACGRKVNVESDWAVKLNSLCTYIASVCAMRPCM